MNFKIIKDTDKKFILRINDGSLRFFSCATAMFSGLAILSAFAGVGSILMSSDPDVKGITTFFTFFLVVAWCFFDWKFIMMAVKRMTILTIERANGNFEIKNVFPPKTSSFPLHDIKKSKVDIDIDDSDAPKILGPIRLELLLKPGQKITIFKTSREQQQSDPNHQKLEAIIHAIEAALHKEILYDGNSL